MDRKRLTIAVIIPAAVVFAVVLICILAGKDNGDETLKANTSAALSSGLVSSAEADASGNESVLASDTANRFTSANGGSGEAGEKPAAIGGGKGSASSSKNVNPSKSSGAKKKGLTVAGPDDPEPSDDFSKISASSKNSGSAQNSQSQVNSSSNQSGKEDGVADSSESERWGPLWP